MTPVILRTQGRHVAGKIVGPIFPLYVRHGLLLGGIALAASMFAGEAFHGVRQWAGTFLVVTALLLTGYQAFGLTPRMERAKLSVPSFETAPADHPARREFSSLHGISMVANLVVLLEGAALIVASEAFRR